jgi:UDP-N-acetylglucosamine 2-epimerase (non-hydrolysing)
MITVILGTKAQLIKMAPVMKRMRDSGIQYRFIHTGQHRETMEEMYRDFDIKPPDITLYYGPDIISVRQIVVWFIRLLTKSLIQRKELIGDPKNGIVLVHGDTLSTLLGALIGRINRIQVGHVESGLRSFNFLHPFPEEITRVIVFRLSNILFCPGNIAVDNVSSLRKNIVDTKFNTLLDTIHISRSRKSRFEHIPQYPFSIVSLHRYENIFKKEQLLLIVDLIERIAEKQRLLFVLHPPTAKQLKKFGLYERVCSHRNIECVSRMHHSDFLTLLQLSEFIITDGGSLQEETAYLGIPCLLFRQATERQEGLGENAVLSSFQEDKIFSFISSYKKLRGEAPNYKTSPSAIIVDSLREYF